MNENEREFFTLVDEDGSEIEFEKIGEIRNFDSAECFEYRSRCAVR